MFIILFVTCLCYARATNKYDDAGKQQPKTEHNWHYRDARGGGGWGYSPVPQAYAFESFFTSNIPLLIVCLYLQPFYCTMLCIARTILSQAVRPSVVCPFVRLSVCSSVSRVSVTRWCRVKTAKHIIKRFSPSGSFFRTELYGNIPAGTSPNKGVECKGYEKIVIFDQNLASSRK